jgi:hypothetical protein
LSASPEETRVPAGGGSVPHASPLVLPPPPPSPVGAGNSVSLAVIGLVRALSVSKIGYFVLGAIILIVSMAAAVVLLMGVVKVTGSRAMQFLAVLAAVVLYVGLIGVLAGGMAHLADMDERGRKAAMGGALGFCARRFVSLFMGAVSFAVVVGVVLVVVNGLAALLNAAGTAGAFLAALWFLPQFAIDLVLGVALAVWVVVPIAIATENLTALQAIGRLQTCLCRDTKRLLVHFAVSAAVGMAVLAVLPALFWLPAAMTLVTNSPLSSLLGALTRLSPDSLMRGDGFGGFYSSGPDALRVFFGALVGLAVMGYLSAYWVGSFTGYYKEALRRGFRAGPGEHAGAAQDVVTATCPNALCGKKLMLGVAFAGKRISCPSCNKVFVVPPPPPAAARARETASLA